MAALTEVASYGCKEARKCMRGSIILIFLLIIAIIWIVVILCKSKKEQPCCQHFIGSRVEGFQKIRAGNNFYKVHEDLDNPERAAETMDKLNTIAITMISHLETKYSNGVDTIKPEYRKLVRNSITQLRKNYRPSNLEENIPERSGGDTSYVINKGDTFAMCLRDPKENNKLDDKMNDLTFVLLHEMTHLFTNTFGHDTLFWNNFKFMLEEASEAGLYNPIDYKRNGSPYCGIVITYSPLFDKSLLEYKH